MRKFPKRSGIAAYEARNICGVLASRRASPIRPFFSPPEGSYSIRAHKCTLKQNPKN